MLPDKLFKTDLETLKQIHKEIQKFYDLITNSFLIIKTDIFQYRMTSEYKELFNTISTFTSVINSKISYLNSDEKTKLNMQYKTIVDTKQRVAIFDIISICDTINDKLSHIQDELDSVINKDIAYEKHSLEKVNFLKRLELLFYS